MNTEEVRTRRPRETRSARFAPPPSRCTTERDDRRLRILRRDGARALARPSCASRVSAWPSPLEITARAQSPRLVAPLARTEEAEARFRPLGVFGPIHHPLSRSRR